MRQNLSIFPPHSIVEKAKIRNHTMKLKEGSAIFDESINFLLSIEPMDPLQLSEGLSEMQLNYYIY